MSIREGETNRPLTARRFQATNGSGPRSKCTLGAFIKATSGGIGSWFICVRQGSSRTTRTIGGRFLTVRFSGIKRLFSEIRGSHDHFAVCGDRVDSVKVVTRVIICVFRECLLYFFGDGRVVVRIVVFNGVARTISMDTITTGRGFIFQDSDNTGCDFRTVNPTSLRGCEDVVFGVLYNGTRRVFTRFLGGTRIVVFIPYAPIDRRDFFCYFEHNREAKDWWWV